MSVIAPHQCEHELLLLSGCIMGWRTGSGGHPRRSKRKRVPKRGCGLETSYSTRGRAVHSISWRPPGDLLAKCGRCGAHLCRLTRRHPSRPCKTPGGEAAGDLTHGKLQTPATMARRLWPGDHGLTRSDPAPLVNRLHGSRVPERRFPSHRKGLRVWLLAICRRSVARPTERFERPTHVILKHPDRCDPDTRKAASVLSRGRR